MSLRADIEKYRKQVLETNDPAQRKAAFLNYLTLSWYADTKGKDYADSPLYNSDNLQKGIEEFKQEKVTKGGAFDAAYDKRSKHEIIAAAKHGEHLDYFKSELGQRTLDFDADAKKKNKADFEKKYDITLPKYLEQAKKAGWMLYDDQAFAADIYNAAMMTRNEAYVALFEELTNVNALNADQRKDFMKRTIDEVQDEAESSADDDEQYVTESEEIPSDE